MDNNNKLEQTKNEYFNKLKRVKLIEAGIDVDVVDTYTKYITADSPNKIEEQAEELAEDVKRQDSYGDVYNALQDNKTWTIK